MRIPPVYSKIRKASIWQAFLAARNPGGTTRLASTALAERYPQQDILFVDSGTTALAMALQLAANTERVRERRDSRAVVALPAWGCPDLGTAALAAGASIILYDLDPATLAPNPDSILRALQHGADTVVVVHFFGCIVDVPGIRQITDEHGAALIEDAAQHAGGAWTGTRAGTLADLGVLSFGRGKGLNAGGGGALLTAGSFRGLAASAWAPQSFGPEGGRASVNTLLKVIVAEGLSHPRLYGIPAYLPFLRLGETHYHPPHPPRSPALASLALLTSALADEDSVRSARQRIVHEYHQALHASGHPGLIRPLNGSTWGGLRYPLRLHAGSSDRPRPSKDLAELGILKAYPRILSAYPELRKHCLNPADTFPGAIELAHALYTLPTHARVSSASRKRIVELVRG